MVGEAGRGLSLLERLAAPPSLEEVSRRQMESAHLEDLMTQLSRRFGPELNRDTVANVIKAGFALRREENIYLDIVKSIEAVKQPG